MLQFFRNNQITTIPLIVLYFIVLFGANIVHPMSMPSIMPQWNILMDYVWGIVGLDTFTINTTWILLILGQVFGLNALINYFKLSRRFTYITTIAVMLTYGFIPASVAAFPILIANIFLTFALFNLFNTYVNKGLNGGIFNATAWLGLATLFYTPYLMLLLVFYMGLYTLRGLHLKENVVFILGILVPYILMGTSQFLMDNFSNWLGLEVLGSWSLFKFDSNILSIEIILSGIAFVLVLLWLLSIGMNLQQKTTLQEKSYIQILYWSLLMAIAMIFLKGDFAIYQLNVLAIPVALLMSLGLQAISVNKRAEIWHWLLLGFALLIQYAYFLLS